MSKVSIGDFDFELHNNGTATIVKYTNHSKSNVTVPHGVNGCDVVTIGMNVFRGHNEITCVNIPDTITVIQQNAFYACTSLERVIVLSDQLYVHDNAFAYCKKLKQIIGEGNMILSGDGVFAGCGKLWEFRYSIGNSIVPNESFHGCKRLEKLSFLQGVTFGRNVFFGCTSMKELWFFSDAHADCDTTRFIKKREIHCKPTSNLVDLAYDGANIVFIEEQVW